MIRILIALPLVLIAVTLVSLSIPFWYLIEILLGSDTRDNISRSIPF